MSKKQSQRGVSALFVLITLILLGLIGGGGYLLWKESQSPEVSEEETSIPREIGTGRTPSAPGETPLTAPISAKPIASGRQTYLISGKFLGPTISKVTIDPQDAKAGQMQKITVEVSDTNPVMRVSVTVKLDTKSNTFDLKLVSGTATQGVWEAEAPFPNDTLFTNYTITEVAESATGRTSTTTTIR